MSFNIYFPKESTHIATHFFRTRLVARRAGARLTAQILAAVVNTLPGTRLDTGYAWFPAWVIAHTMLAFICTSFSAGRTCPFARLITVVAAHQYLRTLLRTLAVHDAEKRDGNNGDVIGHRIFFSLGNTINNEIYI